MNQRFGLSVRVGVIVVVAVFTGLLAFLAVIYVSANDGRNPAMPSPERLAALVQITEQTPVSEREQVIAAVNSPNFTVRVEPETDINTTVPDLFAKDASMFSAIQAVLAPREVGIRTGRIEGFPSGPALNSANAFEFTIALSTGETLLIETQRPFLVAPFGLPIGFGAALIGIAIALITLIMLHREFRPLSRLAIAVDRVDPTGEPVVLPTIHARSPELKALIGAFERLQDRLTVLVRGRMALIGGIQHDIRTFATRLRLRIDKIDDAAERNRAATDIADMIHLLDDALLASRAGASELDQELIDLAQLLRSETIDRQEAGAAVSLEIANEANDASVLGDRLALRRVISNVVDNALKYGKTAQITLVADQSTVTVLIDDQGPGIPVNQRALLLEPFTRIDRSRARQTGGTGLGLAVVRSLLNAHQGSLEIGEATGGGARLTVRLPLFKANSTLSA